MALNQLRSFRQQIPAKLMRTTLQNASLNSQTSAKEILSAGIVLGAILWIGLWWILDGYHVQTPGNKAFAIAATLMLIMWTYPFLDVIRFGLKLFKPQWQKWWNYSTGYQLLACASLLYVLGFSYEVIRRIDMETFKSWVMSSQTVQRSPSSPSPSKSKPIKASQKNPKKAPSPSPKPQPLSPLQKLLMWSAWPLCTIGLYAVMTALAQTHSNQSSRRKRRTQQAQHSNTSLPFSLWLGVSSGALAHRWHPTNLAAQQHIGLTLQDAAQNILILGAIGSGKTTRAVHPLLLQLLDQTCGGLIFDIKGDFKHAVTTFAQQTNMNPVIIGVGQQPFNLLTGLTPEIAAAFLKSALLLANNNKADGFWMDTATELCRNALGVLSFTPHHYHLHGLYQYLFDQTFQQQVHQEIANQLATIANAQQQRQLHAYQYYIQAIFGQFDDKVKSGVLASIAQILAPFQHPDLIDAFCAESSLHAMEHILDGTVYMVDMPLARWGIAGKVIYTLIKLRFFNTMQQRALHPHWNQSNPVFFMCDEYQEIVSCNKDGLTDLNFWDKSRSSKTIGIISAQSVSSFYAAIGDRDLTHALLQNFRQKIIFRVEDDWTIQYCSRLVGQVETQKIVQSSSSGKTSGKHDSSNTSSSRTISYQQKDVVDSQLFRTMQQNQALALLSIHGNAADDVLNMMPVFV